MKSCNPPCDFVPTPMILSAEPITAIEEMLLTEFRTVTRPDFCNALGYSAYQLHRAETAMRYALPADWKTVTFTDFETREVRPNLSVYQVWVLHGVLVERCKVARWMDYARLCKRMVRRDGNHALSFHVFLRDRQRWQESLKAGGNAVIQTTCPQLWASLMEDDEPNPAETKTAA